MEKIPIYSLSDTPVYIIENRQDSSGKYPIHFHDAYELFYIIEGSGALIVDDSSYPLQRNDLIILDVGQSHTISDESKGNLHLYSIYFKESFWPVPEESKSLFQTIKEMAVEDRIISTRGNAFLASVPQLFREIIHEQRRGDEESDILKSIKLCEILISIRRYSKYKDLMAVETKRLSPSKNAVLNIVKYLNSNFYKKTSLQELSLVAGLSTRQFIRIFKQLTGKKLTDYINDMRIAEARRLLDESTLNIISICFEVGFEDISYFYRMFKKYTGITPKDYSQKNHPAT